MNAPNPATVAAPAMGLIEGLLAKDYHAVDACSHSRLCDMRRSAAYCRHRIDHPEDGDALAFGAALHHYVLERQTFEAFHAVVDCERRGTKAWEAAEAANPGKAMVKGSDFSAIRAMAAALDSVWAARLMLNGRGRTELSGFWRDAEHDIPCRFRADRIVELAGFGTVCADLKSTTDASPEAFARSMQKWGYHIQAAWYLDGLAALGVPCEAFVIVAVEKDAPHQVGVYRIDDESVEQGRRECRRLLARYAEAARSGKWTGYSDKIETIGLPAWGFDRD